MLNNFLGEKTFKIGLTAYLKKYQFCNAETKDLWDAWSEVVLYLLLLITQDLVKVNMK